MRAGQGDLVSRRLHAACALLRPLTRAQQQVRRLIPLWARLSLCPLTRTPGRIRCCARSPALPRAFFILCNRKTTIAPVDDACRNPHFKAQCSAPDCRNECDGLDCDHCSELQHCRNACPGLRGNRWVRYSKLQTWASPCTYWAVSEYHQRLAAMFLPRAFCPQYNARLEELRRITAKPRSPSGSGPDVVVVNSGLWDLYRCAPAFAMLPAPYPAPTPTSHVPPGRHHAPLLIP